MGRVIPLLGLPPSQEAGGLPAFEEIPPSASGITWTHDDGRSPEFYLPETLGGGGGFIDYDNDGWMDIYLVNSGKCDFYDPHPPLRNALYHNNRDGTFTDVTEKAGVPGGGFGMAVAVGDYDGDGWPDLYVTQYERNILYHNNGDGTFTDVSEKSGIASVKGISWGVVATDINNDGWMDLWVSNDTVANFLFANRGNGKFEEIALQSGTGYSGDGRARSGMGVDSADYDQDGWMDLFLTDVDQEMFSLYHNSKDETFDDQSLSNGIGMVVRFMSAWGVKFFDYDNDGNMDIFISTGHPDNKVAERFSMVTFKEKPLLWRNTASGDYQHTYQNVSAQSGPVFNTAYAGRGLVIGDYNNDGAIDVLLIPNNGAPVLLRNNIGKQNHWLGIHLIGKVANPDAVGALVTWQAGDLKRSYFKVNGGGYLSSHDPRVVLGIGQRTKIDWVEIKWPPPSGKVERFTNLPIDRYIKIVEGKGITT